MGKYSEDERRLDLLAGGDESMLNALYREYEEAFIAFMISSFSCDRRRAADIYPECMSILYFNVQNNQLTRPLRSTLKTYVFSIGRHLYRRRYQDKFHRDVDRVAEFEENGALGLMVDRAIILKERARILRDLLARLGEPCNAILHHVYYAKYSYEALAQTLNLPEGTLRKRKYDCLKKLRQKYNELNIEL